MNGTPIGWTVQFKISPGKSGAFKGIAKELVAILEKTEPGTLMSQWFISGDDVCRVHTWGADQGALIAHATGIGPRQYLPRLLELSTLERVDVFGTPNAELAKILEAFPVTSQNTHLLGFSR